MLAEEFNKFFISVRETAAHSAANLASAHGLATKEVTPRVFDTSEDLFMFEPVSSSEVKKVIMQMPSNKAPGFDKVSVSVIKDCLPHILPSITSLINSSFTNNTFPKAWKRSEIVPLPKEGDFEQPCNNRPISLLPALSKVSETIALNQFTTYLAKHSKLTPHQSGNKKLHSTETLGLLVSDHIYRAMDDKKVTAMVFTDLSKAFDSLSHPVLLTKLHNLGVSENALAWFKSYLSERLQTTRVATSVS